MVHSCLQYESGHARHGRFLAWHYTKPDEPRVTLAKFVEKFTAQHFQRVAGQAGPRNKRSSGSFSPAPTAACDIRPLREHLYYRSKDLGNKRPQRQCSECQNNCSFYCAGCSPPSADGAKDLVPICGTGSGRYAACILKHVSKS